MSTATTTHRLAGMGEHVTHALGDVWQTGSELAHDLAEMTADRASDAGHAVETAAERAASAATGLGRAARHRAATAAGELRESATDLTGRKRRARQRRATDVRRALIIIGVMATIALVALAARRARQPWAEEANTDLEPGDPRSDPARNSSRSNRHYAAAT